MSNFNVRCYFKGTDGKIDKADCLVKVKAPDGATEAQVIEEAKKAAARSQLFGSMVFKRAVVKEVKRKA